MIPNLSFWNRRSKTLVLLRSPYITFLRHPQAPLDSIFNANNTFTLFSIRPKNSVSS